MRPYLTKTSLASKLIVVLALFLTPMAAFAGPTPVFAATPLVRSCPPGWHYDDLINHGTQFTRTSSLYGQQNKSTKPYLPAMWTAGRAKTVGYSTSSDVGGGISVMFASVRSDVNRSVTESITTSVNAAISFHIQPGQTAYAEYGVERQSVDGHLYFVTSTCHINPDYGYVTLVSPYYQTWNYWCTNPSTCVE